MNYTQLQLGQKLSEEIKMLNPVNEFFSKGSIDSKNAIKELVSFFTECRNLGTDSLKQDLALFAIKKLEEITATRINNLNEEFEKL